jgi:glycosyltransferase involved in cell wall biosynthesis
VTPTVSIGLPVYNGERFLRRSLDALLGQSFRDFELVISDNASTDATPQIISEYAARDSRIRHMRADANAGVEANFRRVLNESTAPYFMWAGCDDWWAPTFVERVFAALERDPNAVVAMSDVQREDENGKALDTVRFSGAMDPSRMTPRRLALLLAGGRPFHLFVYGLFRADVLRRTFTGFAPVVAADRLLMCRMALTGGFVPVSDVLHKRLVRRTSIAERYGDEGIGQLWRNTSGRWRLALSAGPYLWGSPDIPFRRKLLIPAIVLRFAKASLGHSLVQSGLIRPRGGPRAHAC